MSINKNVFRKMFFFTKKLQVILFIKKLCVIKFHFHTFLGLQWRRQDTALRNHNRIVLEEMSSRTPLTMYLGHSSFIKRTMI